MKESVKKLHDRLKNLGWKQENIDNLISFGDDIIEEVNSMPYLYDLEERVFSNTFLHYFLKEKLNYKSIGKEMLAISKFCKTGICNKNLITILEENFIPNNIYFRADTYSMYVEGKSIIIDVGDEELSLSHMDFNCVNVKLKSSKVSIVDVRFKNSLDVETKHLEVFGYLIIENNFVLNGTVIELHDAIVCSHDFLTGRY